MRDDDVRSSCFAALDVLQAQHGPVLPYASLATGFVFRGRRVPFLNRAYGIYRAADVQRGPAALSINSAFAQKRYQDEGTADGVLYRYQDGPIDNHFNSWLRNAHVLGVPLVYLIGTRPNWYRPECSGEVLFDERGIALVERPAHLAELRASASLSTRSSLSGIPPPTAPSVAAAGPRARSPARSTSRAP